MIKPSDIVGICEETLRLQQEIGRSYGQGVVQAAARAGRDALQAGDKSVANAIEKVFLDYQVGERKIWTCKPDIRIFNNRLQQLWSWESPSGRMGGSEWRFVPVVEEPVKAPRKKGVLSWLTLGRPLAWRL